MSEIAARLAAALANGGEFLMVSAGPSRTVIRVPRTR
jgi:hypothetical protein